MELEMAKQETIKEVVVKKSAPPVVYEHKASVVDSADIVVPKLLLAQGLSVSVAEGLAKMGDITNSLTGVVIGGPNKPVPFIPITMKKYWKKFEVVNGKKQFRGTEVFDQKTNGSRQLKEMLPSQNNPAQMAQWEFDLTLDLFGFTEDDVQDPIALPSAISFARTSYKAGQQASTLLASVQAAQLPYYAYLLELNCTKKQNDKGIFYTYEVKPKITAAKMVKTPEVYFAKIERWSKILNDSTTNVVVDDQEDASEVSAPIDDSRF